MFPDMIPKGYVDLNILNEVIRVQVGERELSKLSPKSKTNSSLRIEVGRKKRSAGHTPPTECRNSRGRATLLVLCLSQNKEVTTLQGRAGLIYSSNR